MKRHLLPQGIPSYLPTKEINCQSPVPFFSLLRRIVVDIDYRLPWLWLWLGILKFPHFLLHMCNWGQGHFPSRAGLRHGFGALLDKSILLGLAFPNAMNLGEQYMIMIWYDSDDINDINDITLMAIDCDMMTGNGPGNEWNTNWIRNNSDLCSPTMWNYHVLSPEYKHP